MTYKTGETIVLKQLSQEIINRNIILTEEEEEKKKH